MFSPPLRFSRPTVEDPTPILADIDEALSTGLLTDGPLVSKLEERICEAFEVNHCVAVSSCTIGLMLVIQALDPTGPVLVPSFTFSATAHSVRWNGAEVVFADCDPSSWCLGPDQVVGEPAMILGVHVSGVPCEVDALEKEAANRRVPLIFDAAHGAGSLVQSNGKQVPLGRFGVAEVFSLTPTKVLSGAEGGLITTDDASLAERLRIARNYGNPGNYDTVVSGLNARLSEPHAAIALVSLDHLEERVAHRNRVAATYRDALGDLEGIAFQEVPSGARSSYKDFTVLVNADLFGCSREAVVAALGPEGIETRCYYSPPVHLQSAYGDVSTDTLPITERLATRVISLPIWSHLPLEHVARVGEAFGRIQASAGEIESALSSS